jgi:hypothetical protein
MQLATLNKSKKFSGVKTNSTNVLLTYLTFVATLAYLDMPILGTLTAPLFPIAAGCLGLSVISAATSKEHPIPVVLILLGPGFIVGFTMVTVTCLLLGDAIGLAISFLILLWSVWRVLSGGAWSTVNGQDPRVTTCLSLTLVALALLDLSRNFPVLATAALGVGFLVVVIWRWRITLASGILAIGASLLLFVSLLRRPDFWWALNGSDDPIALMAAGVQFFRFGVSDISGWPTGGSPPIALVAPVIWSKLTFSPLIETFLLANPVFLAVSGFASVGTFALLVSSQSRPVLKVAIAGLTLSVTAGLVGQSPKAHHVVFVGSLSLLQLLVFEVEAIRKRERWLKYASRTICLVTPLVLGLYYHPTLFPMVSLLLVGWLYRLLTVRSNHRFVWTIVPVGLAAVAAGMVLMAVAGTYLGGRFHGETIVITWFPQSEFGWCARNDAFSSVFCRIVIEDHFLPLLVVGFVLAALAIRRGAALLARLLLPVPVALSYVPFILFVTTSYSASGSHLVELGRIAIVLLSAGLLVQYLDQATVKQWILPCLASVIVIALYWTKLFQGSFGHLTRRFVAEIYFLQPLAEFSDQILVLVLSSVAVISIGLAFLRPVRVTTSVVSLLLCFVFAANVNLGLERARTEPWRDVTERPSILGPSELEPLGLFLRKNLPSDALVATNFLCVPSDGGRCTSAEVAKSLSPDLLPENISSWMISALGERRVLYLSQGWYTSEANVNLFVRSVEFAQDPSRLTAARLRELGVTHYVLAKTLMTEKAWNETYALAVYSSPNFTVVEVEMAFERLN